MIRLGINLLLIVTLLAGPAFVPEANAAGANLVVTAAYWGSSQNMGQTAHPGDVNMPLTVLLANSGDDFAREVTATLIVKAPFVYAYYVGDQKFTSNSVTKTAGDLPPAGTFPLLFTLDINAEATEGIHRLTLQLQYKSARELSAIQMSVELDVPVWRGDVRILRVATLPLKVYPGDSQVNLRVVIGNSGLGASKNLDVRLDLRSPFSPSSSGSDRLTVGILSPGMSFEANFYVEIDKAAESGEYTIEAFVSSDAGIPVKLGEIPVFVSEKAKLEIVSVSPETVNVGQAGAVIRVVLRNVGNVEAESVRLQLKAGNFFSGTLTDFLGSLSPGEEKTAFLTVDVDGKAVPGEYRIDVRLDWTQGQSALNDTLRIRINVTPQSSTLLIVSLVLVTVLVVAGIVVRRRRLAAKAHAPVEPSNKAQ